MPSETTAHVEPMPRFLDFEASSLASASYPIEVAWSAPDGSIESHLISPAGIERWTDWSPKAEQLHGIRRATLLAEGKAPNWICRRLNAVLGGAVVYTDDPDYDAHWLTELFSVTWGLQPNFELASADALLLEMLAQQDADRAHCVTKLAAIKTGLREKRARRHRAAWDVEYLAELYRLVKQA